MTSTGSGLFFWSMCTLIHLSTCTWGADMRGRNTVKKSSGMEYCDLFGMRLVETARLCAYWRLRPTLIPWQKAEERYLARPQE